MTALIVIGSIVLFLLLVLLCPIQVLVRYGSDLTLKLRYGFITVTLLSPDKPPKEKKPKKEKKKKKPPEEGEKGPSFFQKLKAQHGVGGLLYLAKEILKLATGSLRKLFSHVVVYRLHLGAQIAGKDAAETAILYGRIEAALEPCLAVLLPLVPPKKRRDVQWALAPDFTAESSVFQIDARAGIKPLFILTTTFGMLFRFLRIFFAANQRSAARKEYKKGSKPNSKKESGVS